MLGLIMLNGKQVNKLLKFIIEERKQRALWKKSKVRDMTLMYLDGKIFALQEVV